MKQHAYWFLLFIILAFACIDTKEKHANSSEKVTNFNDTISFKLGSGRFIMCSYENKGAMEYVAWSEENDMILTFDSSGQIIDSFPAPKLLGKKIGFTKAKEKLFFLTNAYEISEVDLKGNLLRTQYIKLPPGTLIACYYLFPLEIRDTLAFFYQYPNFVINDENKLKAYYRTNRETIFNLAKGCIEQNNSGNYPPEIFDNSYYCSNPIRTINNSGEIIYSYPQSSKLYIYNYLTGETKKKEIKSKFFEKNSHFDRTQIFNYNYISKYSTENSRYDKLVFSPFDNRYYRILTKKERYNNKDGTVTKPIDKGFVIQVLNENLDLEKEVEIPGKKLNFTDFLPIKGGLLFASYNSVLNPYLPTKTYVKIKL